MADKPFSDEELENQKKWCGFIETHHPVIVHAQVPVKTEKERRFLATIAADRKEIKILKSTIETDHAIKKDHRVKIKQQAATIERMRGKLHDIKVWAIAGADLDPNAKRMIEQIANHARQALDTKEEKDVK